MGNKDRYTAKEVAEALKATKGMVYLAASQLGCTAQTIYNYRDRYKIVKDTIDQQDGLVDDAAEIKLMQAINHGEAWAIKFRLATKAKARGYVERQEMRTVDKDGNDVPVVALPAGYLEALKD